MQNGWEYPVMDFTCLPAAIVPVETGASAAVSTADLAGASAEASAPASAGVAVGAGAGAAPGASFGIACPDCTSMDGSENQVRFTLVRSPAYAWHDPAKLQDHRFYRWIDRGEHHFRFILMPAATSEKIRARALTMHRPPLCFDWTAGM